MLRAKPFTCMKMCLSLDFSRVTSHLFSYKPEAFIRSVTLVRLSQDRVKGFTPSSMVGGRIRCYCKRSNVHLHGKSERKLHVTCVLMFVNMRNM